MQKWQAQKSGRYRYFKGDKKCTENLQIKAG